MRFFSAGLLRWPVMVWLVLVAGCTPPPGSGDAKSAARYVSAGKSSAQEGDYEGAQAAFEQALLIDPRLAEAHNDLAVLFDNETQLNSPEKALYHYLRVLELDPNFRWADVIKGRLNALRLRLADSSARRIVSPALDKEIEELQSRIGEMNQRNLQLRTEIDQLKAALANCQAVGIRTNSTPVYSREQTPEPREQPRQEQTLPPPDESPRAATRYTIHQFQKGDSLYSLGRRHGIHWQEIVAANPGLDARSIQPGTNIRIPVK